MSLLCSQIDPCSDVGFDPAMSRRTFTSYLTGKDKAQAKGKRSVPKAIERDNPKGLCPMSSHVLKYFGVFGGNQHGRNDSRNR